jgi:serine/threonine protein kinase
MDISILHINEDNYRHKQDHLGEGAYSNVYDGVFLNRILILKSFLIKTKGTRNQAIKEWFLLKIVSALEIGPKMEPYFGFDILMYRDCVEFAMEKCELFEQNSFNSEVLYYNLAILHSYHIVHCDIKPENIMLSPTFRKAVFIDFNLSKMIKENIG